ncbi:MAG: hypothetical protein MJ147_08165 [Clostridia bacterium]|nr:hypothetical protein [Clostridia bacterium]
MKNSFKTAFSGMAVALGAVFMLLASMLPFFEYAVPAAAGIIILFVQAELNKPWALGAYIATSLLGVFVVPNKEAVGMYIALFGIYPIIKSFFDKLPKVLSYILKTIFFVADVLAVYYVMINLLFISSAQELMEDITKVTLPLLIVCGLVAFLVYDRALMLFERNYKVKYHKYVMKLFRR